MSRVFISLITCAVQASAFLWSHRQMRRFPQRPGRREPGGPSWCCSCLYVTFVCVRLLEHAAFILRLYLVYIDMIPGIRRHHFTYLILYSFVTAVGRYVLINSYNRTSNTSICDGIALVAEGPAHQQQILSTTRTDFVQRPAESTNFLTLPIRKSWIGRHPESELINPEQQTHGPTPK